MYATTLQGDRMSFSQPLTLFDPEVAAAADAELERQQSTLEMIASENFAPVAVMQTLSAEQTESLRGRVAKLAAAFPLYPELNGAAA
ncbi:hypothetical protein AQJ64_11050 [Streptomyces griseoruber]|uniref:Serine hydroxymethyltransferase-like domain-containing protein n=1 Tax=Streptomyces griseoruber TaxID=1943 RepID=A0A117RE11_9ACTN|nr:hypothetical protein AQJ64_11050 [Streptomyces griseoruber]